jgi:hypothetical protein
MKCNNISTLVKGSNDGSINNEDRIFFNNEKKEFYTANRLVSKCHQVINYLCDKIIKLEKKLPNLFRSTKIISIATSYLNRHMAANDVLSAEYKMSDNSNKVLTGETLKEFISINELKEDNIPYDIGVLSLTFDKNDVKSFRSHLGTLIMNNTSIHHIEHDLNSLNQDNKTKFLNHMHDGRYLLTDVLATLSREMTKNEGNMTQWQKECIKLLIEHGANICNVDSSGQSAISRAINDRYHKDLILFLIGYVDSDSFQLQKNEYDSVLSKAIKQAKQDKRYIPILKQIIDKGVNLDLPINDEDEKADKQLIDSLIKSDSKD